MSTPSRDGDLQARSAALQARAAALRSDFGRHVKVLQTPLAGIDRVRRGVAWLSRRSLWPATAFAVFALLGTRQRRRAAVPGRPAARATVRGVGSFVATSARWGNRGRWAARAWWGWRMVRGGLLALRAIQGRPPG